MCRNGGDLSHAERVGLAIYYVESRSGPFRTIDLARHLGIPWDSAKRVLEAISTIVPLYQDDDARWHVLDD